MPAKQRKRNPLEELPRWFRSTPCLGDSSGATGTRLRPRPLNLLELAYLRQDTVEMEVLMGTDRRPSLLRWRPLIQTGERTLETISSPRVFTKNSSRTTRTSSLISSSRSKPRLRLSKPRRFGLRPERPLPLYHRRLEMEESVHRLHRLRHPGAVRHLRHLRPRDEPANRSRTANHHLRESLLPHGPGSTHHRHCPMLESTPTPIRHHGQFPRHLVHLLRPGRRRRPSTTTPIPAM